MKKTIFVVALSIAGFIAVWRFEPTPMASTSIAEPPATQAPPAPTTAPSTSANDGGYGSGSASSAPSAGTPSTSDNALVVTTGTEESSQYGTVQVQLTYRNGKITTVRLLQAPTSGRGVNALPLLKEETLKAQSANIDTVSGATETSESYKTSLQAAIDKRGA